MIINLVLPFCQELEFFSINFKIKSLLKYGEFQYHYLKIGIIIML